VFRGVDIDNYTYRLLNRNTVSFHTESRENLEKHNIQFWESNSLLCCNTHEFLEKVFYANNLDFIIEEFGTIEGFIPGYFYCALRYSNFDVVNYFVQWIKNNQHSTNTANLSIVTERWDDDVQILDL
jgi:hypothetical protein